ncbi:unnamed protein product [Heterobilharzia americana]|nr:unnamed protein product [Heterobilharzia americana]
MKITDCRTNVYFLLQLFRKVTGFRFVNQLRNVQTSTSTDLKLTFASSGQAFYNNTVVRQVDVPTITGRFGVLPNHVPTVGCLKPGVVAVTEMMEILRSILVRFDMFSSTRVTTLDMLKLLIKCNTFLDKQKSKVFLIVYSILVSHFTVF